MTPLLAQRPRADRTFERLYRRHVGDVYRYALALMRNQADAEDVTQTTFLNAYRAFQRGDRPERPQNWLIAIAHNVCRQRFRQSARRPKEVGFDDDVGAQLVEVDNDVPTGEDIRRALGHLAFNQRAALVMRELEGRSYGEIAEILDLSPSAVETLIFRARRALREQLESSLTCGEAELAISRQLDGRLSRAEKGALRAHLRECSHCATFARRQRAQRTALRSLAAAPVPGSLLSWLGGGGGSTLGSALALKAATAVAVGAVVGGAGYEGIRHVVRHAHAKPPAPPAASATRPAESAETSAAAAGAAQISHLVRTRGASASAPGHVRATWHRVAAHGGRGRRTHGAGHIPSIPHIRCTLSSRCIPCIRHTRSIPLGRRAPARRLTARASSAPGTRGRRGPGAGTRARPPAEMPRAGETCVCPAPAGGSVRSTARRKERIVSIVNRRNAVMGWAVWKVAKRVGKKKAREAVPGPGEHAGLNKSAIATIVATITGALFFWRKKSGDTATE